ncbi:MAG: 3-deoxy-D-manno-octulosonic acid transferase [Flavobacteriaceae bacterium]
MFVLYHFVVHIGWTLIRILSGFNSKLSLFVKGRRVVFQTLEKSISTEDRVIWMHTASLGEYEQGLPVLERLKDAFPSHKLLLTFFSPSGHEVKKNSSAAHVVTYLPMDTPKNVRRFLDLAHPELALFVKYEIWPVLVRELSNRSIPKILFSAIFNKNQIYFKWYGGLMKKTLATFDHIFLQDEASKKLLESIGLHQLSVSGDTRFDRVLEIMDRDNQLKFMEDFKADHLCFVAGSTWPEDENILVDHINNNPGAMKYVLVPHDIKPDHITKLKRKLLGNTLLYSELENANAASAHILILDAVGLLTKVYSYADIAYVGGGFATGLHNTLEPAIFGIPIIIGPAYGGFREAEDLVGKGGIISIAQKREFSSALEKFVQDGALRQEVGNVNKMYVWENKGASLQIMAHIRTLLE